MTRVHSTIRTGKDVCRQTRWFAVQLLMTGLFHKIRRWIELRQPVLIGTG